MALDLPELHDRALAGTRRCVAGVGQTQWRDSTPCEGWDVRELVNHIVSGNFWAGELARGKTIEEVGDRLYGDVLVEPGRPLGEVPCAAIGIGAVTGVRERLVNAAALLGLRTEVHRRAHERMPEAHLGAELDQAGRARRGCRVRPDAERGRCAPHDHRVPHRLGRGPTVADIATDLAAAEEDVIEVLGSGHAHHPVSLDAPTSSADDTTIADTIGAEPMEFGMVEYREALRVLIHRLPEREQRILAMRFYGNLTQTEIAGRVGMSQMHVSRLLSHALDFLRRRLSEE